MIIGPGGTAGRHFPRKELVCHCGCDLCNVDSAALAKLDEFRDYLGFPVICSSCCRCEKKNAAAGGKRNSYHIATQVRVSRAFDIHVTDLHPGHLMEIFEDFDRLSFFTGRGIYPADGFIHVDSGHASMTRWIRDAAGEYHYLKSF